MRKNSSESAHIHTCTVWQASRQQITCRSLSIHAVKRFSFAQALCYTCHLRFNLSQCACLLSLGSLYLQIHGNYIACSWHTLDPIARKGCEVMCVHDKARKRHCVANSLWKRMPYRVCHTKYGIVSQTGAVVLGQSDGRQTGKLVFHISHERRDTVINYDDIISIKICQRAGSSSAGTLSEKGSRGTSVERRGSAGARQWEETMAR